MLDKAANIFLIRFTIDSHSTKNTKLERERDIDVDIVNIIMV
jgi:hypothetical protein